MENPLNNLKLDHWYKMLIAASFVVFLLSLTVKLADLPNNAIQLMSLGVFLFATGEWRNHPLQTKLGGGIKITSYPRRFTFAGSVLNCVGIAAFVGGIYRLTH